MQHSIYLVDMCCVPEAMSKKNQLNKERPDQSVEIRVKIKELENKITLVHAGVPIKLFQEPGMDVIHEKKFQKNKESIAENVSFNDVVNNLRQNDILRKTDLDRIKKFPDNHGKMLEMLSYLAGPKAYQSFRYALKDSGQYDSIIEGLDQCVVKADYIEFSEPNEDDPARIKKFVRSIQEEICKKKEQMTEITKASKKPSTVSTWCLIL